MRSALTRRLVAAGLPIAALSAATSRVIAASRRPADVATAAVMRQIDDAERSCKDAKRAHDAAHEAFEAVFPKLHWTLDVTEQRPRRFRHRIERGFNGSTPHRRINKFGLPDHRYIATVETLGEDLKACPFGSRGKTIRRMLRRATKHEAAVARAEEAFRLEDVEVDLLNAQHAVHELAKAVFARPATALPEIRVQARMLRAFVAATPEQWGGFKAGEYGAALAANLDQRIQPPSQSRFPRIAKDLGDRVSPLFAIRKLHFREVVTAVFECLALRLGRTKSCSPN